MEFEKTVLKNLQAEMTKALAPIAAKHGIDIGFGGGRYEAFEATLKLVLKAKSDGGLTQEQLRYAANHKQLDLPPPNTTFSYGRDTYRIDGLHRTKHKSVLCVRVGAQHRGFYCFYPEDIRRFAGVDVAVKSNGG